MLRQIGPASLHSGLARAYADTVSNISAIARYSHNDRAEENNVVRTSCIQDQETVRLQADMQCTWPLTTPGPARCSLPQAVAQQPTRYKKGSFRCPELAGHSVFPSLPNMHLRLADLAIRGRSAILSRLISGVATQTPRSPDFRIAQWRKHCPAPRKMWVAQWHKDIGINVSRSPPPPSS